MTDKDLKRLSRAELLEMLLEQSKVVKRLEIENQKLIEQLEDRQIKIDRAGSIAEAALQLNKVFETAQQAADQYLENVRQLCEFQSDKKES